MVYATPKFEHTPNGWNFEKKGINTFFSHHAFNHKVLFLIVGSVWLFDQWSMYDFLQCLVMNVFAVMSMLTPKHLDVCLHGTIGRLGNVV
jgi:hypothetical protein